MTLAGLEPLLAAGAAELGIDLDSTQRAQLLRLLAELTEWNQRFNLTGIDQPQEMLRKHLLDSLSLQPFLLGERIADVGSGAGFPGLPLAVVNPLRRFTLIESTTKKAGFLQHAIASLELQNVEVYNGRAETWHPQPLFTSVTARALGKLPEFVRVAGHLCANGGRLLAMKGQYPEAELDALPKGWRAVKVHHLRVPGLDAERHLVELTRAGRAG